MRKSRLEAALLKQLPTKFAEAQINTRLEDVTNIRLWAAEQRMNAQTKDVQSGFPFGEDFGASGLAQIHVKYIQATSQTIQNKLVCPICGESDKGNKKNNVPFCLKCNVPLIQKDKKVEKVIRNLDKRESMKKELSRINPGLNPKGSD
jgi:ribosomal protein L37AE/L43A